ncbi:MAG TPA: YiiD C-terminal domain-containing protein [Phycisphaerae bacterium]|nr:YiiD C-terminal domain-containing protein [Phycisphaerae bacterium]
MPTPPPFLTQITEVLHTDLPLTRAMGVQLTQWDGRSVTLTAPLAPNHNHTDTAFGGSISSIAILAGYTALFLLLRDRDIAAHLLIQKSAIEFLRPIDTDLTAEASLPPPAEIEAFLQTLQQKRRGRLSLESRVLAKNTLSATHTGLYVAIRR